MSYFGSSVNRGYADENTSLMPAERPQEVSPWYLTLKKALSNERVNKYMDWFQAVLSFIFGMLFVWQTYYYQQYAPNATTEFWLRTLTVACMIIFLLDMLRMAFLSVTLLSYFRSKTFWVDVISIGPLVVYCISEQDILIWLGDFYWRLTLPLRFLRLHQRIDIVIKRMKRHPVMSRQTFAVRRQIFLTLNLMFNMVLCGAGYLQIVNIALVNQFTGATDFADMVFDMVIMMLTIGYPDNDNPTEHMIILVFIVLLFAFALPQIYRMLDLMHFNNSAFRKAYRPPNNFSHVILAGETYKVDFLLTFLTEFFHEDHGVSSLQVVILSPTEPDEELAEFLDDPVWAPRVRYIKGNILDDNDLILTNYADAAALLLMTNTQTDSVAGEGDVGKNRSDAINVVRTLKLMRVKKAALDERYKNNEAAREEDETMKIIIQVIRADNKVYAFQAGADEVMSVDQMRLSMLAKDCVCPGFSTLICNLTRSSSSGQTYEKGTPESEYADGLRSRLYETVIPQSLDGISFTRAVSIVYEQFGAVLVGVYDTDQGRYILNPGRKYRVQAGQTAYIIAASYNDAVRIKNDTHTEGTYDTLHIEPETMEISGYMRTPKAAATPSSAGPAAELQLNSLILESMQQHLLVLSLRRLDHGFRHFIDVLRSGHITTHLPIVVLCQTHPSQQVFSDLFATYPDVYFVCGDPMSREDLIKCRIALASHVVILANSKQTQDDQRVAMDDADGIFLSLMVQQLQSESDGGNGDALLTASPTSSPRPGGDGAAKLDTWITNNKFPMVAPMPKPTPKIPRARDPTRHHLGRFAFDSAPMVKIPPKLANTSRVCSNILELNNIASMLLLNEPGNNTIVKDPLFTQAFQAGIVFSESLLDLITCQILHIPHFLGITEALISCSTDSNKEEADRQGHIFQFEVPTELGGEQYQRIFTHFLNQFDLVTVGLYRYRERGLPYVYTHPPPLTRVSTRDRLFCLIRPRK